MSARSKVVGVLVVLGTWSAQAEELLVRDGGATYIGFQRKDVFETCDGEKLAIHKKDVVKQTSERCRRIGPPTKGGDKSEIKKGDR